MAIQNDTPLPVAAEKNGRRLILFPAPMQGHFSPMLHLANLLLTKGFSITIIYTNFMAPDLSNYPQFTFRPIDDALPESIKNAVPNIVDLPMLLHNCIEPFRNGLAQLLAENAGSDETIPCLIVDALWAYTSVVKEKFDLPVVVLWTESMATALFETDLPLFRDKGYFDLSGEGSELEAWVPECPFLKFKDISKIMAHHPKVLYQIMDSMITGMKAASAIIWNACKELEQPELPQIYEQFPTNNFFVGPIHKYYPTFSSSLLVQDPAVIPWLDSQSDKSVTYVSFGSMPHITEADFAELAWGLANSMKPFLWVVRPGSVNGYKWIESLPDDFVDNLGGRGLIVKWAPQLKVLAHPATAIFLTHNGWNSTIECISEGVPMICAHGILDQPINSRYVTGVWKVGTDLENGLERDEITSAVRKMLVVDEEDKEIRERLVGLKKAANECVKEGGSSRGEVESFVDYILSLGVAEKRSNGTC